MGAPPGRASTNVLASRHIKREKASLPVVQKVYHKEEKLHLMHNCLFRVILPWYFVKCFVSVENLKSHWIKMNLKATQITS